jgi:O-antigen/teichoic acid export membrane protein
MTTLCSRGRQLARSDAPGPAANAAGVTTQVARGSLWTLGGYGVTLVASLVATPFVIRLLGSEAYGVLVLINVALGYLTFADAGMGMASTRFASEAYGRSPEREAAVVWTSLLIASVPALLAAACLILTTQPLVVQILRLPPHLHDSTIDCFRLAALTFVARNFAGILNTPQLVRLRLDIHALIQSSGNVVQVGLVPVVLALGGRLRGAVTVGTIIALITLLIQARVSLCLLPKLRLPRIERALIGPLLRHGSALMAFGLAGLVMANAEKIILPRFTSMSCLAHYSVAFTLASMLTLAPTALCQSLMPAFARLRAQSDGAALQRLYAGALRSSLLCIAPAGVIICVFGKNFLRYWAGAEYARESAGPLCILVGGLVFNALASVPLTLLNACGRMDLVARYNIAEVVPYLLGVMALTFYLGARGAALAWSSRAIVEAYLLYSAARKVTGCSVHWSSSRQSRLLAVLLTLTPPVILAACGVPSGMLLFATLVLAIASYLALVWQLMLTSQQRSGLVARTRGLLHAVGVAR